jgi:UDP-N-acetylmuramoyl-L-alanyl-D-glutamate--2,6-diaminopimelate ligase
MPALQHHATVDAALGWLRGRGVRALATDSRRVQAGDAFIAWPGYGVDGRRFVPQALAAGAAACLVEADGVQAFGFDAEPAVAAAVTTLDGLKAATGPLASAFMGTPSEHLQIVASTGTNGKTSTAWWTAQALAALGRRCGVVGTLGVGEPPTAAQPNASVQATGLTTPDPVTLQAALRRFVDQGFAACALEASSIGLVEQRLAGTRIAVALFTNFTQDHLDFHDSMTSYWQAKAQLFEWPGLRAAVLNIDDEQGAALALQLRAGALDVWTYSMRGAARLRADAVRYTDGGLRFEVHEAKQRASVHTGLIGDYNVANLLAVLGALRALGVSLADAARACTTLTPVPGRMQRVAGAAAGPDVVVDYAHTPDALDKALLALQPFAQQRSGRLWCVFGCGGDRDAGKRPLMGAVAARLAQRVVVTSDNPRTEAPAAILAQIVAGIEMSDRIAVIEDRRAAIAYALREAGARDVILIAGKGHEDYQDVAGVKHPFSDVAEAQAALRRREATA